MYHLPSRFRFYTFYLFGEWKCNMWALEIWITQKKIINSLGDKESCDWALGNFLRGQKTKKTLLRVKCTSLRFVSSIFFLYLHLWYFIMAIDGTEAWKYPELLSSKGFPGGSGLKNLSASARDAGTIPGKDPWKKEMATHSSNLACEIQWTEEPGRLQGLLRVKHSLSD